MAASYTVIVHQMLALVVCLSCLTSQTGATPTAPRRRRRAVSDSESNLGGSIVLGALTSDTESFAGVSPFESVPHRRRRSAGRSASPQQAAYYEALAEIDNDPSLDARERRQRRSALLLLQTSLRFCDSYPHFCRRVEVDEGDVRVRIRVESE